MGNISKSQLSNANLLQTLTAGMIKAVGILILVVGTAMSASPPAKTTGSDPVDSIRTTRSDVNTEAEEFLKGKSPEEVDWYLRIKPIGMRMRPDLVFVKDNPALPRVLLIGDSISLGYTLPVRELLKDRANVHRIPGNGGETARGLVGLQNVKTWLGTGKWDVIHFNFGIHDLKRIKDGKWDITGKPVSSPAIYEKNLREVVVRLKATGARLIWASTTQIPEGAAGVPADGEIELNVIAAKIMKENNIPINDLHAHLAKELAKYQNPKNVHFGPEGYRYLAQGVAAAILDALPQQGKTAP